MFGGTCTSCPASQDPAVGGKATDTVHIIACSCAPLPRNAGCSKGRRERYHCSWGAAEKQGYFWTPTMRAGTSALLFGISLFCRSDSYHHYSTCFSIKLAKQFTTGQRWLNVEWNKNRASFQMLNNKIAKKYEQLTVLSIDSCRQTLLSLFPPAAAYSFGSTLVRLPEYLFAMIYPVVKMPISHSWIHTCGSWVLQMEDQKETKSPSFFF